MSRKFIITEKVINKVYQYAVCGFSRKEIAESLGIAYSTFHRKIKDNYDLKFMLERGEKESTKLVENKLFKVAMGYSVEEEKTDVVKDKFFDKNGNKIKEQQRVVKSKVEKYIPPKVSAIKFYLQNNTKKYQPTVVFQGDTDVQENLDEAELDGKVKQLARELYGSDEIEEAQEEKGASRDSTKERDNEKEE